MSPVAQRLYSAASVALAINPELRWGQSVFTAASEMYPGETNELRGGPVDPFYLDGLTELFMTALVALVKADLTIG